MVTHVRGRPIENVRDFDWMSEFQIGGQAVLRPRPINAAQRGFRTRMVGILHDTNLGHDIMHRLVRPTISSRNEHDGYILAVGRLTGVVEGRGYGIAHHDPPEGTSPVGYAHTHPASTQIRPPTIGRDWLDSARYPIQLMIESLPRRVWGLISPNLACIIGLLETGGAFSELERSAPQAGIIYAMTNR
jgi:hypothetical protein